jgi:hypothetical protein
VREREKERIGGTYSKPLCFEGLWSIRRNYERILEVVQGDVEKVKI